MAENAPTSFYFLPKHPATNSPRREQEREQESGSQQVRDDPPEGAFSWLTSLISGRRGYRSIDSKMRKVPTKVEPKVFFANERTFLAWMHMAVTLSSISVAIIAFAEANEWSMLYGLLLMPVAISFCCYSLWMYMKRATMIRGRHPGPYEDKVGPVVLASMLAIAILVNFSINLFTKVK